MKTNFKKFIKSPKALIIFACVLVAFFLIDWLTKTFIFDSKLAPLGDEIGSNYKVIGLRSFAHDNSTLFSSLSITMPLWARILINLVLTIAFIIPIFFTKRIFIAVALGILVAGMFGNTLDVMVTSGHYVRDIFFTPWADRGTFNAGDVFIVFGAGLLFISVLIELFKSDKTKKEKAAN